MALGGNHGMERVHVAKGTGLIGFRVQGHWRGIAWGGQWIGSSHSCVLECHYRM